MLIGTSILDWFKPRVPTGPAEQLAPGRIIERLGPGGIMPLPEVALTPPPLEEWPPMPNGGSAQYFKEKRATDLEEAPEKLWWLKEKWATPYMAAIAYMVGRGRLGGTLSRFFPKIMERLGPGEEAPISPQTELGAAPEFGEWFKKNQILIVVVSIVTLVLLFFFLRKGRR